MHVCKHVVLFFEKYELFSQYQSGSRKKHSCETALLHITDFLYSAISTKKDPGVLFTDFSKAFDLIDHSILLKKLKQYKFVSDSVEWFSSYLSNRSQVVRVGNCYSESQTTIAGIPQGSILGPILFLIYTIDLLLAITKGLLTACVDDATILCTRTTESTETNLQQCSTSISEWCKPNKQVLNASKMAVMSVVGPRSTPNAFNIAINGTNIDQVHKKKILGLTIDSRLTFYDHITNVRKLALWHLSTLRRIAPYCNLNLRTIFYNSFLYPHFIYCSTVWSLKTKDSMEELLKLQKYAARTVLGKGPLTHSLPLFLELQWVPLPLQFKINKLLFVFKSLNNLSPTYLSTKFTLLSDNGNAVRTRHSDDNNIFLPAHTSATSKTFSISGTKMWNSLNTDLKSIKSLLIFKSKLRESVLTKMQQWVSSGDIWCPNCSVSDQLGLFLCDHD